MIKGEIEQFLDTGWYSEATLFYRGYIYWCEGYKDNNTYFFFINKWKAENENNLLYHSIVDELGEPLDFGQVLKIEGDSMDILKKKFFESKVFDGKTFWEVEREIFWLDEGKPILNVDEAHGYV